VYCFLCVLCVLCFEEERIKNLMGVSDVESVRSDAINK
jgi:hypothetical protein